MSEDDTIGPADGGNLVAAEYVLGVLGAEERREVERRLPQEPALATEVAFWEERLGWLADAVPPVTPPPQAWSRIEAAISAPPAAAQPVSLWNSLEFWRAFGIGAGAIAAASVATLTYIGILPTPRAATVGDARRQRRPTALRRRRQRRPSGRGAGRALDLRSARAGAVADPVRRPPAFARADPGRPADPAHVFRRLSPSASRRTRRSRYRSSRPAARRPASPPAR